MKAIHAVLTALRRVIRATDLHSKHLEKTAGLSAPQLLSLQTLRDQDPVTIGDLAREMNLSQATVTTIIDRLENRGLVVRQSSSADKRKVHAALAAAGARLLETAPMPLQNDFIEQFQNLCDWEQAMIIAALQRVAHMMDAENLDAAPLLDVGALDRDPQPAAASRRRRAPRKGHAGAQPRERPAV